jgi:predicted enzyme related to lactoylglutathione lyase
MVPMVVSIHINTGRPELLGEFYQKLFCKEPAWSSEGVTGFMFNDFRVEIAKHDQVSGNNPNPERIFFDLMVADVRAEFTRIVALGATVIQEPYDFADEDMKMTIATLADLDGNYFQLVSLNG